MISAIYIENEKLDLYEDESIIVDSSLAKITDITKIFTDTSNKFDVPASPKNNRIVKHWYNFDIQNGFDARTRKPSLIELRGQDYKFGKLQLTGCKKKNGKPFSYSFIFYGNLVDLKNTLGDDKLSDIDFSSYDFNFNATTFLSKMALGGNDIQPVLFTDRRLIFDSSGAATSDSSIVNIARNSVSEGLYWYDHYYSIRLKTVIDAINSNYPSINIVSDFFESNEFDSLYMVMPNKSKSFIENIYLPTSNDPKYIKSNILSSYGTFIDVDDTTSFRVITLVEEVNVNYTISVYNADGVDVFSKTVKNDSNFFIQASSFTDFSSLTFRIKSDKPITYRTEIQRRTPEASPSLAYITEHTVLRGINSNSNIASWMPDIKVLDWLKNLFYCFRIVGNVDSDGVLNLDTLVNYYKKGVVIDLTKYVDVSEINIEQGTVYKEVNYNFKEPKTILANEFIGINDYSYGDKTVSVLDVNGELVEGDVEDVKIDFEQVVYERLQDELGLVDLGVQYGLLLDENLKNINLGVHIHYISNISLGGGGSYYRINGDFNNDGTVTNTGFTRAYIPSHTLGFNSPQYATVFNDEFNEYDGVIIRNNLYTNYHKTIIDNITSANKREYSINTKKVPIHILNSIQLKDVIKIGDDLFRIDTIKSNITTGDIEFKLLGGLDIDLDIAERVTLDRTDITLDSTIYTLDNV